MRKTQGYKMKNFKYIEWHNGYSSGVYEIDSQHKKLISILNDSIKHSTGNQAEEEKYFNKRIVKAIELLEKHYNTEEEILSATEYERLNKHKEEHNKFLEMMKKRMEGIKNKEIKLDLFKFSAEIKELLIKHIITYDQEAKEYFKEGKGKKKRKW